MKKTNKITINNNITADVVIDGRQTKITKIRTDKKGNILSFIVPENSGMYRMIGAWDADYDLCYEAAKKAGMIEIA